MFKDYYSFKNKDKRERWVYNRDSSVWKKEKSPRYSERFLNTYLLWWVVLVGLVFTFVLVFYNLSFTNELRLKINGSPLLVFIWIFYILVMFIFGIFIRRFFRGLLFCTILSIIAFFTTDILLLNYETPLYFYMGSGFAVSFLFMLCVVFIRHLAQREPKDKQKSVPQKPKDLL